MLDTILFESLWWNSVLMDQRISIGKLCAHKIRFVKWLEMIFLCKSRWWLVTVVTMQARHTEWDSVIVESRQELVILLSTGALLVRTLHSWPKLCGFNGALTFFSNMWETPDDSGDPNTSNLIPGFKKGVRYILWFRSKSKSNIYEICRCSGG